MCRKMCVGCPRDRDRDIRCKNNRQPLYRVRQQRTLSAFTKPVAWRLQNVERRLEARGAPLASFLMWQISHAGPNFSGLHEDLAQFGVVWGWGTNWNYVGCTNIPRGEPDGSNHCNHAIMDPGSINMYTGSFKGLGERGCSRPGRDSVEELEIREVPIAGESNTPPESVAGHA